jgi:hypothetical protein
VFIAGVIDTGDKAILWIFIDSMIPAINFSPVSTTPGLINHQLACAKYHKIHKITNVPVVYMGLGVWIWMGEIHFSGCLKGWALKSRLFARCTSFNISIVKSGNGVHTKSRTQ